MRFSGTLILALVGTITAPVTVAGQARFFAVHPYAVLGTRTDRSAGVTLGDIDGDGDLDAVVANGRHWAQENEVFLNNGLGTFTVARPLSLRRSTSYATPLADFDGDGDLDVAVANDRAPNRIYRNDGTGLFEDAGTFGDDGAPARSLTVADIDGDGLLDLLVTNRGAENAIYLNDGAAGFSRRIPFGSADDATISVAVGDVDRDGDVDLVLANREGEANYVYLNGGGNRLH